MTLDEIEEAFASDRNLFVTGAAGTGKSYLLNSYIRRWEDDGLVVYKAAPTGLAALNFEGGTTLHRLFKIPVPYYDIPHFSRDGAPSRGKKGYVCASTLDVIGKADVIIIDEISMARNDVFRYVMRTIRKAETAHDKRIRVIVCGDFSQLPPVVKANEPKMLKKNGLDPSGFAFTTTEWASAKFLTVELTDVKRQDNLEFIEHLHRIRVGDFSGLSYWDRFVTTAPDFDGATVVCGTNADAAKINESYLDSLPGETFYFEAKSSNRAMLPSYIDALIKVKVGAQVIFTANDTENQARPRFMNGQQGIVDSICKDGVWVNVKRDDGDCVRTWVKRHKFEMTSIKAHGGDVYASVDARIEQYPFRLGKAITIHKSQGQTYDKVVVDPKIFAPGQLYVALSRAKGPEGFCLMAPLSADQLMVDDNVRLFYKNGCEWRRKPPSPAKKKAKGPSSASSRTSPTKKTSPKKRGGGRAGASSGRSRSKGGVKAKPSAKTTTRKSPAKKSTARAKTAAAKAKAPRNRYDSDTGHYTGGNAASPKSHTVFRPKGGVAAPKHR